jgi:DNA-binding MarR family transcriptional regulator
MRPEEELRFLILAGQREGNRQLAQALRPMGVTPAQAEVLRLLDDRAPLTLSGLGELLVCESGTNPSRLVDRLVGTGLVNRVEAQQDRRVVELTLTAAGRRVAKQIAGVEELLYGYLRDAARDHDLDAALALLRALVRGTPAGEALARRAGRSA